MEKAFERREELLAAAISEFSEKGYDKASINVVLKKAGVSKGSFYYHFKNKEELYYHLLETMIATKKRYLADLMQEAEQTEDLFAAIRLQARLGIRLVQECPDIERFGRSFMKEQGRPIYEKALQRYGFAQDAGLQALIAHEANSGRLRMDLPTAFMARAVSTLLTHATELTDTAEPLEMEETLEHLIMLLKDGLSKKPKE